MADPTQLDLLYEAVSDRVEDTQKDHPYDLMAFGSSGEIRIEVKGTTGAGETVKATAG